MAPEGCYAIAIAAGLLYAAKGSLVGAIRVRMAGVWLLEADRGHPGRVSIRSVSAACKHNGILDLFGWQSNAGRSFLTGMLVRLHRQTIGMTKVRRLRSAPTCPQVSSEAVSRLFARGLVVDRRDAAHVAREPLGAKTSINYATIPDPFKALVGGWERCARDSRWPAPAMHIHAHLFRSIFAGAEASSGLPIADRPSHRSACLLRRD